MLDIPHMLAPPAGALVYCCGGGKPGCATYPGGGGI